MFPVPICWAYDCDEWIKFCLNQKVQKRKRNFVKQQQMNNQHDMYNYYAVLRLQNKQQQQRKPAYHITDAA